MVVVDREATHLVDVDTGVTGDHAVAADLTGQRRVGDAVEVDRVLAVGDAAVLDDDRVVGVVGEDAGGDVVGRVVVDVGDRRAAHDARRIVGDLDTVLGGGELHVVGTDHAAVLNRHRRVEEGGDADLAPVPDRAVAERDEARIAEVVTADDHTGRALAAIEGGCTAVDDVDIADEAVGAVAVVHAGQAARRGHRKVAIDRHAAEVNRAATLDEHHGALLGRDRRAREARVDIGRDRAVGAQDRGADAGTNHGDGLVAEDDDALLIAVGTGLQAQDVARVGERVGVVDGLDGGSKRAGIAVVARCRVDPEGRLSRCTRGERQDGQGGDRRSHSVFLRVADAR